jgi:hypothetical protein
VTNIAGLTQNAVAAQAQSPENHVGRSKNRKIKFAKCLKTRKNYSLLRWGRRKSKGPMVAAG